jgi:putative transposase
VALPWPANKTHGIRSTDPRSFVAAMLCSQLGSTTRNSTDAENSKFGREYCYVRHGPTTLLAALDIATGAVFTEGQPCHRHQEFLSFLRRLDAAIPEELEVHLIVDNYATHPPNADLVGAPSPLPPPLHPTHSSWLNQVERWFGLITQRTVRRGSFRSVKDLIEKIDSFVQRYNRTHQARVR